MNVVQERNTANNAIKVKYVRSGNIGGLLSKTDVASGSSYYYHYDGGGNVVQLTDATQAVVARYEYDSWGNPEAISGAQSTQPYRWSTKELNVGSGLYDYGYRFYSPALRGWINRDPIGEAGGLNLYAFVDNSPTNGVDDYGREGEFPGEQALEEAEGRNPYSQETYDLQSAAQQWAAQQHPGSPSPVIVGPPITDPQPPGDEPSLVRNVPNPNGRNGCPAHQQGINDAIKNITDRGLEYDREYRIDTPNGIKSHRAMDVVALDENKQPIEIWQVGRTLMDGITPVARERSALSDVMDALDTGLRLPEFHFLPYP